MCSSMANEDTCEDPKVARSREQAEELVIMRHRPVINKLSKRVDIDLIHKAE